MQERIRNIDDPAGELRGYVGAAEDVSPAKAQAGCWAARVEFFACDSAVTKAGAAEYLFFVDRDDPAAAGVDGGCGRAGGEVVEKEGSGVMVDVFSSGSKVAELPCFRDRHELFE